MEGQTFRNAATKLACSILSLSTAYVPADMRRILTGMDSMWSQFHLFARNLLPGHGIQYHDYLVRWLSLLA